jgi:ribonuclease P protein component
MQRIGLIAGFLWSKEHPNEANLPTLCGAPQADAWLPRAHADAWRARGHPRASREGSRPARHLTLRESGRARLRLRRHQRLGAAEVSAVLKSGRLTRSARLYLYRSPNSLDCPRLALVVPKRFAPRAVLRNRIRRLAREAFRLSQVEIGAQDCVLRLVKAPGNAPVTREELEALFRRSVNG